jgi:hypothetical protein
MQETKGYSLTSIYTNHLEVIGYSDSDFVECIIVESLLHDIFSYCKRTISWKCSKQTMVGMSTMKT